MHITSVFILVLFFHENLTFSWMSVLQDPKIVNSTTEIQKEIITTTSPAPSIKCQTAKNVTGLCVLRQNCDYGATNIDLTLYAPRWYKIPCKPDEVCCPDKYILVQTQAHQPSLSDDYFQLDDDY
ncbi:uncharacterized protein LOC112045816 [Bicyclus anynana]|uniref:Uncharacterized protein LOC112045816 n=1 Tax=Bicyclus anynana TaxID=110368 RepID=A0A6J1MQM2_BICAN|nr:uncharacterized protein LOC112045816 [Bicyclus anynana]